MPTSSIFTNVIITSDESAQAIIRAFESFEKSGESKRSVKSKPVTDPDEIKRIVSMWKKYNSSQKSIRFPHYKYNTLFVDKKSP